MPAGAQPAGDRGCPTFSMGHRTSQVQHAGRVTCGWVQSGGVTVKGVGSIGDASRAALDALRPTPFGDMPTFLAGAQLSAKIRDWLAMGMALPLTWSVGNACPVSFSDCLGGALRVVATSGAGSGGRTWSAICIFADAKGPDQAIVSEMLNGVADNSRCRRGTLLCAPHVGALTELAQALAKTRANVDKGWASTRASAQVSLSTG